MTMIPNNKNIKIVSKYSQFNYLLNKLYDNLPKSNTIKIIDVGCAEKRFEKIIKNRLIDKAINIDYIGLDFSDKPEVDIKIDVCKQPLPFADNSVDIVICNQVLEHLIDPFFALKEMIRVLKNEGLVLIATPFLFPVHDKKNDYFRYTHNFYREYFKDHTILAETISNASLSFPLYVIYYYIGTCIHLNGKILRFLQYPLDKIALKLFPNKLINYVFYQGLGYLVKIKK